MKPLKIISFMDGRPGHEKQTRGILNSLKKITPIEIHYKTVIPSLPFAIRSWLIYANSFIKKPTQIIKNIDLIIGTGSYTHVPMLFLKKQCGAKVVTCMTPDLLSKAKIDLCFIPWHDHPKPKENIFLTIGSPNTATDSGIHDPSKGLILVGGVDNKSHIWNSEKVIMQINTIIDSSDNIKNWTISSSRRTPDETINLLRDLTRQKRNISFFNADETPGGWIENAYTENEEVWVTADSISMIYEALSAGCAVGILPVCWKKSDNKFKDSLDYLIEKKKVILYENFCMGKEKLNKGSALNEAHRCAEEILRRWWKDRLQ